ncbi:MAG: D-alanyl-D-alanine carboxypeptidase/D-alanyl-D-alanine-endopeptidase [Pseudomonadota bacterium]
MSLSVLGGGLSAAPFGVSLRPKARPDQIARASLSVHHLIEQSGLSGQTTCLLRDLSTGDVLFDRAGGDALPPASIAKTVTALFALDVLGADRRFSTELLMTGSVDGGTLNGDLILRGGGDPHLDSDGLAELAADLGATGIRRVKGRLIVDGSALPFIPELDSRQPDHVGYNPAISGLNLNFNRVHFDWKPNGTGGWNVRMDARTRQRRPQVRLPHVRIVDRERPVYLYEGEDRWSVSRRALGNGGARWLPVKDPALYAGRVLRSVAREFGVDIPSPSSGPTPLGAQRIAQRPGARVEGLAQLMLRHSTNLTAELLGLVSARQSGTAAETIARSASAMNDWAERRLGAAVALRDHSGLLVESRVSARAMVEVMSSSMAQARLQPLLKPFKLNESAGHVVAKTGSLNFVSTLTGYLTPPGGGTYAFAILSADMGKRSSLRPDEIERPPGGRAWIRRARNLQRDIIGQWSTRLGAS